MTVFSMQFLGRIMTINVLYGISNLASKINQSELELLISLLSGYWLHDPFAGQLCINM